MYCKFYYRRRYKQVETCHEKARKSFVQILSFGGELYMSLLYFHPLTTLHCNSLVLVQIFTNRARSISVISSKYYRVQSYIMFFYPFLAGNRGIVKCFWPNFKELISIKMWGIDAKGMGVSQSIWLSKCPIKGHFRAKNTNNTKYSTSFIEKKKSSGLIYPVYD